MAKVFITLTGTKHYFGNDFLKKGTKIRLEKEPDNEYDKEAIKVTYEGLGKIGYVANSSYTVIGDSMSAGRLYDKIGKTAYAKVELVTPAGTICKVCKKSLKNEMKETMKNKEMLRKIYYENKAINRNMQRLVNIGLIGILGGIAKEAKASDDPKAKILVKAGMVMIAITEGLLLFSDILDYRKSRIEEKLEK